MGNTEAPLSPPTCILSPPFACSQAQHRRNASDLTLAPPLNGLPLLEMQHALTVPECFYVLHSLLQQYYSVYRRTGKVAVGCEGCIVTPLGELRANVTGVEGEMGGEVVCNNLVSMISQVLEVVQTLAGEQEWLDNPDCAFFHDSVLKLIYRYHSNEDLLFQELTSQLTAFMEFHHFRCNLLPAILRATAEQTPPERLLQRKKHRRYDSESIESFARKDSEFAFKRMDNLSQTVLTKNDESTKYSHIDPHPIPQLYRCRQIHTDYQPPARSPPAKAAKNFISAQFSMNIACAWKEQQSRSKVRFKKYTHKMKYDPQGSDKSLKRNKTTANFHQHPHKKSVLEDLARSVEVRDEPGSKSFIF